MTDNKRQKVDDLVAYVREHPYADLYRARWGDVHTFEELPSISREDLLRVPLTQRRYKKGKSFVKIVNTMNGRFLSEWAFDDIRAENFGLSSERIMVALNDSHEAVEKSIWCYENKFLRVVAEKNPAASVWLAERFRITSLIADFSSLEMVKPFLASITEPLDHISVFTEGNDISQVRQLSLPARRVRLVLALPEIGVIAESELEADFFTVNENILLENKDGQLSVTKLSQLVTPIIKFQTNIKVQATNAEETRLVIM